MNIQSGKLYENRTWKYLYPCLNEHGDVLKKYLDSFFKLGVGIADFNNFSEEKNIHILIATSIHLPGSSIPQYRMRLAKFLDWIKIQHYYVDDYIYSNIGDEEKHMVVLKLPTRHTSIIDKFINGKYSEMYIKRDVLQIFGHRTYTDKNVEKRVNIRNKEIRDVLTKNPNAIKDFQEKLKEEFNVYLREQDLLEHELDFPPLPEEEIFNLKKRK